MALIAVTDAPRAPLRWRLFLYMYFEFVLALWLVFAILTIVSVPEPTQCTPEGVLVMVDMKKVNKPSLPGWFTWTILGIFCLAAFVLVFMLSIPLIFGILIAWLLNPAKVKALYKTIRGQW
jgi:hypothetical protein